MKKLGHLLLSFVFLGLTQVAVAQTTTLGGLTKAKTAAEDVKTGLFALIGVVALLYMLYLGVMAFTEKKSWADFGWGAVHVSCVGGAVALGGWAWTLLV